MQTTRKVTFVLPDPYFKAFETTIWKRSTRTYETPGIISSLYKNSIMGVGSCCVALLLVQDSKREASTIWPLLFKSWNYVGAQKWQNHRVKFQKEPKLNWSHLTRQDSKYFKHIMHFKHTMQGVPRTVRACCDTMLIPHNLYVWISKKIIVWAHLATFTSWIKESRRTRYESRDKHLSTFCILRNWNTQD